MPYKLDFLGLVHFFDRGREGKLVLLPDGSNPAPLRITPHYASFFIQNENVDFDHSDWWEPNDDPLLKPLRVTEFRILQPSRITMSGMEQGGNPGCWPFGAKLDAKRHKKLPELANDPNRRLQIIPEWARTIVQMPIRQGTLESFLFGGYVKGAGVSRLTVEDQSGPITILARPDDGSGFKTLKLNVGTEEIVLANTSNLLRPHAEEDTHFRLYGRLDVNRRDDTLTVPPRIPDLDPLVFNHRFLQEVMDRLENIPDSGCSNTCC